MSTIPQHFSPFYSSFSQSYYPPPNPYLNPTHPPQQHFPPPNFVQYPFSEPISGSRMVSDPLKGEKKKKPKTSSKLSSTLRNE